MFPILGRFGPFLLYSYEVVLGLGVLACIASAAWLLRDEPIRRRRLFDAVLVAAIAAILGGRIIFVLTHWPYYAEAPGDIWLLWRGGLSYHGALIFGLAAFWIWTSWRNHPFEEYAREVALLLALLSVFGWFACLLEGCAYGREASHSLLSADLPDSYGVYDVRYQTQLIGALLSTAVLAVTIVLYKRLRPLQLFWLTMGMLATSRLIVTLFRGDEAPLIGQLRLDTIIDGFMAVAAIVTLAIIARSSFTNRPG